MFLGRDGCMNGFAVIFGGAVLVLVLVLGRPDMVGRADDASWHSGAQPGCEWYDDSYETLNSLPPCQEEKEF